MEKQKVPVVISNKVIIAPSKLFNDLYKMKGSGIEIVIDHSFNPERTIVQWAEALSVPLKLRKEAYGANRKVEILPGDIVFFHWHAILMAYGIEADPYQEAPIQQNAFINNGIMCAAIEYGEIYGYERDRKFHLINDYIVLDRIEVPKQILIIPSVKIINRKNGEKETTISQAKFYDDIAMVKIVPDSEEDLKPGDIVFFRRQMDLPISLKEPLASTIKNPIVVPKDYIIAIVEDINVFIKPYNRTIQGN